MSWKRKYLTLRVDDDEGVGKAAISSEFIPLRTSSALRSFQAVGIQEGPRLSFGVSTRLQRVCPNETLEFNDGKNIWQIPPSVRATSPFLIHRPNTKKVSCSPPLDPSRHDMRLHASGPLHLPLPIRIHSRAQAQGPPPGSVPVLLLKRPTSMSRYQPRVRGALPLPGGPVSQVRGAR